MGQMLTNYPPRSRKGKGLFSRRLYQCAVCRRYSAEQRGNKKYECTSCGSTIIYHTGFWARLASDTGHGRIEILKPNSAQWGRSPIASNIREEVEQRDRLKCRYCGKKVKRGQYELDHVIPYSQGGPDAVDNLVIACKKCNRQKGKKTLEESGMKLRGLWRH